MMPMKSIILIGTFLHLSVAQAFVWEDCRRVSDAHIFGITTTTGMYVSSTGECSAYRTRATLDEAREFIDANQDSLKQEIAAAKGEHLDALTAMFRCTRYRDDIYPTLQKYYKDVVGPENRITFLTMRSFYVRTCPSVLK